MKIQRLLSLALLLPLCLSGLRAAELEPTLEEQGKHAVDAGLNYLRASQADDGSWSASVGVTALALRAFLQSPDGYSEEDGAFITRPIEFILAHVNEDGSISESDNHRNYNTAVSLTALAATGNDRYAEVIRGGQDFLRHLQFDEEEGYSRDQADYGGIGYGGNGRPDLSNAYMALEGLRATALDPKDPVWEKALLFVSRTQNRSESNDQEWAGNDGGFIYMPGFSPHGGTESYGGMTAAGLLSLLFAGTDRNDPRVQAAYDWIRAHYTLEENPGATDGVQGLFYYYNVFAKSMDAYGEPTVVDVEGVEHDWREDIIRKLVELQRDDGSWVNPDSPRWWEGNPDLVTAWSVIALDAALN